LGVSGSTLSRDMQRRLQLTMQRRKRSVSLIARIKLRVGGAPEPFNCFKIFDMLKVGEEETPPTGQSFSVWVLPGRPR